MSTVRILSPAKINIYLKILDKRPDGFHNLQTIFLLTDLCDEICFKSSSELVLTCESEQQIPNGEENLVMQAALLLQEKSGIRSGANIHLKKIIPVGAGLGGGSSNAATTLIALNKMWGINYSREKLMELGDLLGSDVSFFLLGAQTAIGEGKGEKLHKLPDFPQQWMTIVYPNTLVSTKRAYQKVTNLLTESGRNVNLYVLYNSFLNGKIELSELLYNDFEEVIFSQYTNIYNVKKELLCDNAEAAILTGSGSAVVGFFKDKVSAVNWQNRHSELKSFVAQPLHSVENLCIQYLEEE